MHPAARWALVGLLVIAVSSVGWVGLRVVVPAWRGIVELRAAQEIGQRLLPAEGGAAAALQRPPQAEDLAALEARLAAAAAAWDDAASGLAPLGPLLRPLQVVPIVGPPLAAAPDLATLAGALSGAGADLLGGLRPVLAVTAAGGLSDQVGPAIRALRAESARLQSAERRIDAAALALQQLEGLRLDGPLASYGERREQLVRWMPLVQQGVHALAVLPGPLGEVLGLDGPRTYLVLGQTEEEHRATGGYLGSIGVVRVENGKVVATDFRDSRDWSNPAAEPIPAPTPLARFMGFGAWYVRDANWFAEFPTSAAWLEWFLARDWGLRADGAVAIDQTAVRGVLQALGPVDLPAYGERITADNLRERTTYWLYAASSGGERREYAQGVKSPFVAELGQAIMRRLFSLDRSELPKLLVAAQPLLAEKHLLVTVKQPALAALLREQGWDGRLPTTGEDTIYVLEHTASYSKVAPFVEATHHYTVTLDTRGQPIATQVTLRFENRYDATVARALYPPYYLGTYWDPQLGREAHAEGYYAALLRLYVPLGSTVVEATGWAATLDPDEEAGRAVFGGLMTLPAGASRTVSLAYRPGPVTSPPGAYALTLPRQPGSDALSYSVTVRTAPGTTVAASEPRAEVGADQVLWQGTLHSDQRLVVYLRQS